MGRTSKYEQYNDLIDKLCEEYGYRVNTVALKLSQHLEKGSKPTGSIRAYVEKYIISLGEEPLRTYITRYSKVKKIGSDLTNEIVTDTETNQYAEHTPGSLPSAWCVKKGRYLTIQEFCKKYGLNPDSVKSSPQRWAYDLQHCV
jgi:hypothetical protein